MRLRSPKAILLLTLGWTGLSWLGLEVSQTFGEHGSHAAARAAQLESLLAAAEAPAVAGRAEADFAEAERMALEALLASPIDNGALTLLGLAADARGDAAEAKRLVEMAAERSAADLLAQAWLFRHHLAAGDPGGALPQADVILRARPDLLERMMPALSAMAADPQGLPALARHLAAGPPWRGAFLERLPAASPDPLGPRSLYVKLMESDRPPTDAELRPYVLRLVEAQHYDEARHIWMETLPDERRSEVGHLYNGGFEEELTGFVFDWVLQPVAGATTSIAELPGTDPNHALRVEFLDRRVPFRHVRQLLVLAPGNYRLTGRAKAEDLRNERGLHWMLTCAEDPTARLGDSERVRGTAPWHSFEMLFDVPAAGCTAQWLTLELAARIPSERHAAGIAWYDDLAIVRLDEPGAILASGEANVAYGQSAGGGLVGPAQAALAPVPAGPAFRVPGLMLDLGRGETRPPTSQ